MLGRVLKPVGTVLANCFGINSLAISALAAKLATSLRRVIRGNIKKKSPMAAVEDKFNEIFSMSQDPALAEVGGGHGQKGVDFQRFWAMVRIFELKQDGATDFLILFESIQDVAELNSEVSPTSIDIYQIKKKDSGEWSFNLLTGLPKLDGRKKKVAPLLSAIEKSPIGKLYKAGLTVQTLESRIHFVSNAGCDLPLSTTGTAAKQLMCLASELDSAHVDALSESLALLHAAPGTTPDLNRLSLRKTTLHPDDPEVIALGTAVKYLAKHMPKHAGQAKALVDSLFMQLSALGRKTEPVKSFAELRKQRGFSKKELDEALECLESVPDMKARFDMVLGSLSNEGLEVFRKIAIDVGAARYFSSVVSGTMTDEEEALISACDSVAGGLLSQSPLLPALDEEAGKLKAAFPTIKETDILAYLLIRVTKHAET